MGRKGGGERGGQKRERVGEKEREKGVKRDRGRKKRKVIDSLSSLGTSWLVLTHDNVIIVKLDWFIGLQ